MERSFLRKLMPNREFRADEIEEAGNLKAKPLKMLGNQRCWKLMELQAELDKISHRQEEAVCLSGEELFV